MPTPTKYQAHNWFDSNTMEVRFGVDAFIPRHTRGGLSIRGKWYHVSSGGAPLFFDTEKQRDEWVREKNANLEAEAA